MKNNTLSSLRTQLLLVAAGQGLIFWYAIEKIFYIHQGITLSQIVVIGMVSQGSKIVFELPTSIYADRWSRRRTLLVSNAVLALSSLVIGLAHSFHVFILGAILWALNDALRSGVYEAFAYDSLKVNGLQKHYRKVYTRMVSTELTLLTLAGLLAGWVGHIADLRINFFLSIIPVAAASFVLFKMKEPPIARTKDSGENWLRHLSGATKIMKGDQVRWIILLMSAILGFTYVWYEYYQLVGISVEMPEVWFGVLIGALTMGMVAGAELSHKRPGTKPWLLVGWATLAGTLILGLRPGNAALAVGNLFILFIAMRMIRVYLEVYLHDHIPSERRATILSLAGTLSYIWFFLLAGAFSLLLPRYGARLTFTFVSIPILILALFDIAKGLKWSTTKKAPFIPAESDHVVN
jgi:MFS family permease